MISYFQRKNLKSQKVNQPNKEVQKIHPYIQLLGILILTYGAFLLFSISFLDANTPLDDRILSPIFIALLVLFTYFAYRLLSLTSNTLSIKISMILVACFFSISYLLIGTNLFIENYNQGLGFSRLEWQHSELVEQIKKLPNETIIHSNAPYAVYILSGRPALSLPKKFESMNQQINKDFESEMEIISSEITLNNGMVVFFDLFSRNPLEEKAELESNFRILNQTSDGTIFTPNPEE